MESSQQPSSAPQTPAQAPEFSSQKAKLVPPADPNARRIYWLNRLHVTRQDGSEEELKPTPEVIAVAIAKCSRFDTPFDQNVDDVSLEKAAEFHEKWVVGYGHASVAEHATSSIAIENISQIVLKHVIEDSRLASYTEKSTRYQPFVRERMITPLAITRSAHATSYNQLVDRLYDLYREVQAPITELMKQRFPKAGELSEGAYNAQIRAKTLDATRGILPAGYLTAVGMTANARVWEMVISKLLSHPLEEAQQVGEELKRVLKGDGEMDANTALREKPHPTLVKYASHKPYLHSVLEDIRVAADSWLKQASSLTTLDLPQAEASSRAVITRDDELAEVRIAAALLTRISNRSYAEAYTYLRDKPIECERIITASLANRGSHDAPPREFEHAQFQHEIVTDYGAWKDIQRHRMTTQTNQLVSVDLGYTVPEEISAVGFEEKFHQVMREATSLYHTLVNDGLAQEAQYLVPMIHRTRMLVSWNLRELFHFIELRSGIKGHPEYRRVAQEVWRTLEKTHPSLAKFVRVDLRGSEAETGTVGANPKGI